MIKTQTLKGFRDFLPSEKRARDIVINKIKKTFELFGFEPLETPTLEYADLLLGKYGQEADKLIYSFDDRGDRKIGLRYDQTVPTARVLSQYLDKIPNYFRRYQIQNVFRADKPQKGRYREFTQCDIDIFNSKEAVADAELLACAYFAYKNIGFKDIVFNINSREDLKQRFDNFSTYPLSNNEGQTNHEIWNNRVNSFFQSLDKIEKIGKDKVILELRSKNFQDYEIELVNTLLNQQSDDYMSSSLKQIVSIATELGVPREVFKYSPLMVRGLDYYTGLIFEVTIPGFLSGSVGGGGRYDNLISDLGGPNVSAVGMAFGFDRTIEAAQQLNLLPNIESTAKVFVCMFEETQKYSLEITKKLRNAGVNTELSTITQSQVNNNQNNTLIDSNINNKIFKKLLEIQLKLVDRKKIPFVIIAGSEEQTKNIVVLKNMQTKEQVELSIADVISKLS